MNLSIEDATTVRHGLKTPTGIDPLDVVFGERVAIGPHTARPYEDGAGKTCWKCVECGELNPEYDLHHFLIEPCRPGNGTELHDWRDDPREHASDVEDRVVTFDRSGRPWDSGVVGLGPIRQQMRVPASFKRVDTGTRVVELDLDGGGRVREWRKWPVYECPHCERRFRGPDVVLASRSMYPDWARTTADADPGAEN